MIDAMLKAPEPTKRRVAVIRVLFGRCVASVPVNVTPLIRSACFTLGVGELVHVPMIHRQCFSQTSIMIVPGVTRVAALRQSLALYRL